MQREKQMLAVMVIGILRRIRTNQSKFNDSLIIAGIIQSLLIQTGNVTVSDFIIDRAFDRKEREDLQAFFKQYEGIL
jgi:hypothetical protein